MHKVLTLKQDDREKGKDHAIEEVRKLLDESIAANEVAPLGEVVTRTDVKSTISKCQYLPAYKILYPKSVIEALGELYAEYNLAFGPLEEANREWPTDYQYCKLVTDRTPVNYCVQIDMMGLPDSFLQVAANLTKDVLKEVLRWKIFEIENSIAMYQLLEQICSNGKGDTLFNTRFRATLEEIRSIHHKPIALLAVTHQKHKTMKESEFGKTEGEFLSNEEVKELSGFDAFWGPEEFKHHLQQNGGESTHLLYVRSSDPVEKLKHPRIPIEQPLLKDPGLRREIKAKTITYNIDAPDMPFERKINDTKEYMALMKMGFLVSNPREDFQSPQYEEFIRSCGIDPLSDYLVRAKPSKFSYGCYGHLKINPHRGDSRKKLKEGINKRGRYLVQPEMKTPRITNTTNGQEFTYIDRNWFSFSPEGKARFVCGYRSLMPADSTEVEHGRIHGSIYTVWAEIHD